MTNAIAKHLGVTATGLRILARAVADRLKGGTGYGGAGMGLVALQRQGLADDNGNITKDGESIVNRARAMGW